MTKRLTLSEIREKHGAPDFSKLTSAEKAERIAASLERSRQRIEEQSRMMAELRRRKDPNRPPEPKLGLRTWEEINAYVDRIAKGSDKPPD